MANEYDDLRQLKDQAQGDFATEIDYAYQTRRGLGEDIVREISAVKGEPQWMLDFRLKALDTFMKLPMPTWGADLGLLNFEEFYYFMRSTERKARTWEEVPGAIKDTFERLGIPEAERRYLAGVETQMDSEAVYSSLKAEWEQHGIIFVDMDTAVREYPDLVREHISTVVPIGDNKFAALNSAFWSGGSFVYVPQGVNVEIPLQAYFRINAQNLGQFERTIIIADEGSNVHYIEGCTAPQYSTWALHTGVIEIFVKKGAHARYTTIQNWSRNVYNLVTQRAVVEEEGSMTWVDGNLGCLTGDAMVLLAGGVKPISEVEPGEWVYAVNADLEWGRYPVVAKKCNGPQLVFRLQTENYRTLRATANHPFLTLTSERNTFALTWKRLDQLQVNDWIAISGDLPDDGVERHFGFTSQRGVKKLNFPPVSSEDLLWLLGIYIGDGYMDTERVYFAVPPADKAHPRLLQVLKNLFGVDYTIRGSVIRINSVQLCDWFKYLGFEGTASEKRIPRWIYTLPRSQRFAFIQGYIDADGYRRENHKNISITSVNQVLLEEVKQLALSCGLDARKISRWTRREKKPLGIEEKEYTHYFLYFGEHKSDHAVYFRRVTAIEACGTEDTWDLEISGAHNFVANGIIVHNSGITMKYPAVVLRGPRARGEVLSIAFAGDGQHYDAGAKAIHLAPHTTSLITSKSISKGLGRSGFRGLVRVVPGAIGAQSKVTCDALLLDPESRSDTYPYIDVSEDEAQIEHEATVSKISEDQLFYLMSRGLSEKEASAMIVNGFLEPFVKELPMEYAVELNRLIALQMEGTVG